MPRPGYQLFKHQKEALNRCHYKIGLERIYDAKNF